jgi:hypothetical protein
MRKNGGCMRVPMQTSSPSAKTGEETVAEEVPTRAYELYEEQGREN